MSVVYDFNVYPNEVEDCFAEYPGAVDAAVIGVFEEITGEAVKTCILRRGLSARTRGVITSAGSTLFACRVFENVLSRDDLQKSNSGNTLRRELRAPPVAELAAE